MTLDNMRGQNVRAVIAMCRRSECQHEAILDCDDMPGDVPFRDIALRLRCSAYRGFKTQPA